MVQMLLAFVCRHRLLRSPLLAALLFRLSLQRIASLNPANPKYVVLLMMRPGLTEDALTIFQDAPQFAAWGAPQGVLKAVASNILAQTIDEQNYVNLSPEEEETKTVYRDFLQQMLKWLLRMTRIDAIISGNFAYFAERELHAASESLGLPFIVLHKESLKSEGRVTYFEDLYRSRRGAFTGRRIAVYNELERDIQVASGVVTPDRVSVCGMPRLDRLHAWRRLSAGKQLPAQPSVLFFTFAERTGLPGIRRKNELPGLVLKAYGKFTERMDSEIERLSWTETLRLTMQALAQFAAANPQARVIMKSKRGYAQQHSFRAAVGGAMPGNIEWVEEGDPMPLLEEAWAVIGMNSTAVLESVAAGKTVLTPAFGEAGTALMRPWLTDFGAAVERMETPEQLVERLTAICAGPPPVVPANLEAAALETLRHWSGNADGQARERVRSLIERELAPTARTVQGAGETQAFTT